MKQAEYDHFQHKHNFSVWASARAAQRAFTTVAVLKEALENCGVVEFLKNAKSLTIADSEFDNLHREWCRNIVNHLTDSGVKRVTFGRAAKLLAVYLKSMVVISDPNSGLARVAHPPIDQILLQNLARTREVRSPYKRIWKRIRWTQLSEQEYYELLGQLRSCLQEGEPMWHLERYWTVTNE